MEGPHRQGVVTGAEAGGTPFTGPRRRPVATWADVRNYVHQNYRVDRDPRNDLLGLNFDTGDGRSQMVYLQLMEGHGQEWVRFGSIVGEMDRVNGPMAHLIGSNLVGAALQMTGDSLAVVNFQLLATIDGPEIDLSLTIVAIGADALEEALLQSDEH